MPQPPLIDARGFDDLLGAVVREAAQRVPEWDPRAPDDAGMVLAAIYAHYLEILLDRLNRVPEKHFLAFLDLVGMGRLPPGVARVPLVFSLASTASAPGVVPAGTQVATVQTETRPAVVFETERLLTVVPARLGAAFTVEPAADRFADRSDAVSGSEGIVFAPFAGDRPIEHVLFLGSDPLFQVSRPGQLVLDFAAIGGIGLDRQGIEDLVAAVAWETFRAGAWQPLPPPVLFALQPLASGQVGSVRLAFPGFAGADVLELPAFPLAAPRLNRWIRGRLARPIGSVPGDAAARLTLGFVEAHVEQAAGEAQVQPPLAAAHPAGTSVLQLFVNPSPNRRLTSAAAAGATTIRLLSLQGFTAGDVLIIQDGAATEFVTLGPVPATGNDVPIVAPLRFAHAANTDARRVVVPANPALTALSADAAAGDTTLALAAAAALIPSGPDDVKVARIGEDEIVQITGVALAGIPPDAVHVNTTPVDFTRDFLPLGENPRAGDTLHVASTEALSKVDPLESGEALLDFTVKAVDATLVWEFWDGSAWKPLAPPPVDTTDRFTREGTVRFRLPTAAANLPPDKEQEGLNPGFALRVTIADGGYPRVPALRAFTADVFTRLTTTSPVQASTVRPGPVFSADDSVDLLTASGRLNPLLTPLDTEASFFPFGTAPEVGQTFYFILPGNTVKDTDVTLHLAPAPVPTVLLQWEYLSEDGWQALGRSSTTSEQDPQFPGFRDATLAFTRSGLVRFRRPRDVAPGEVNGLRNHWVRARVLRGVFGRRTEFVLLDVANPARGFRVRPGTGAPNPPIISAIRVSYTARRPPFPVLETDFRLEDALGPEPPAGATFRPFRPVEDQDPTCYLGFDQSLPNEAISLYFVVPPRTLVDRSSSPGAAAPEGEQRLVWEYWNGRQWAELAVADDSRGLTESGRVELLGPADMAPLTRFDLTPRFWLRLRRVAGSADVDDTLLGGVFLNAVEAVQATTVRDELLGSSSARPQQVFRLTRTPVLPGQQLLVREPERPPAVEEAALIAEEGADAVQVRRTADGTAEVWVRWHEVASFYGSGSASRHYTLDRIAGEVRFGNGVQGMIPPQGTDNVVCALYRAGGGEAGNQPAGSVSQLKTSLPFIAAVTNPVAADGGSPAEPLEAVSERGPQTLRHRDRAVTPEDLEWLARQAAGTSVARARCLPGRNRALEREPGWATLVIVPADAGPKPQPSPTLIRAVEDYLAPRALGTLAATTPLRINVIGPSYLPVALAVEVEPAELAQAGAVRAAVLVAIERFLHPLTGGPDGTGWPFGRDVFLSELFAAFEAIPGVEHVRSLAFRPSVATVPLRLADDAPSAQPAGASITLAVDGQVVRARLVELLPAAGRDALVTLFQDGERVRLTPVGGDAAHAISTTVRGIAGSTLSVDPFRATVAFPAGSEVAAPGGSSVSFLTAGVAQGDVVRALTVQGFAPGQVATLPDGSAVPLATEGDPAQPRLALGARLRVPDFGLVYSGPHVVRVAAT